ncbi:hypothetical protein BB934_44955 (plasmid) [Microvirga ossetica]|uniref:Uncharacterized protein n=1 Tax=Microvirga ossetica TaxID=1882682 RepID=A0A1B2EZA0_9HYPH|nr:hypothetical protein [Microvirga ossetica]ANY85315.1 hypothetical protein BB934_44955 [Microvirga ossetica]
MRWPRLAQQPELAALEQDFALHGQDAIATLRTEKPQAWARLLSEVCQERLRHPGAPGAGCAALVLRAVSHLGPQEIADGQEVAQRLGISGRIGLPEGWTASGPFRSKSASTASMTERPILFRTHKIEGTANFFRFPLPASKRDARGESLATHVRSIRADNCLEPNLACIQLPWSARRARGDS